MNKDEMLELMTVVLDGTASPQEQARLTESLRGDPEARRLFEEARAAADALKGMGPVEMPDGLRGEILRGVRRQSRSRPGIFPFWAQAFRERPALGLVPALAVGAAVGILIFSLLTGAGGQRPGGAWPLGGTICPLPESPEGVRVGEIDLGPVGATAWSDGRRIAVLLDLAGEAGSPVTLAFDPSMVRLQGIQWPCGLHGGVDARGGNVIVTPQEPGTCEIDFVATGDEVDPAGIVLMGDREEARVTLRVGL